MLPENLPVIPPEEYPRRWARVQETMTRRNLDILIAYADDRAVFGPAHTRWLAGFPVHFEPVCILMFPEGDPVLLCGPESDEYARIAGRIPQVRVLREFTHPDEDYPFSVIRSLREIIGDLDRDIGTVRRAGLAGRGLMAGELLAALTAALPGAEWIDAEHDLCDLRACKSPTELAVIRYAYRLAEAGLAAAIEAIRPDVCEREIAAVIETAMRGAGAEGTGIDTIVASGPNTRPILARSTFRKIDRDDMVLLTIAPRYEGYHAAIGRPVFVGNPGDAVRRAREIACRAQEACFAAMRPDVEGRIVEKAGRRIVEAAGLGDFFLYSGVHSVGVIEFEPPIFGPSSPAVLKPDMVISVDIPMFNAPWGGLRVEDGFLITQTGAERLHHNPFVIEV
ncbi:MAG: aminopeptidase P family protein [candidate division Zixibacteria bacterium]|nr:aminopeptidase P family protein [candidate division Zixibacteria bacterium]